MRTIFRLRSVALIATIAMMGATAFVASGATGAYFSDTNTGEVTGTFGSIALTTSGGDEGSSGDYLDFDITNLLPGVPQSVTIGFANSGLSAQDVYLSLDPAAIDAFTSGAITGPPAVSGTVKITRGDGTVMWNSAWSTWTAFPASGNLLIRGNVAPAGAGTFTILVTIDPSVDSALLGGASSPTVSYSVVATQVGIAPGA